ncbi:hypothetical protein C1I95_21735 [Micromonospora craterilacus]|uniref:Minor tail protein n=1 Tax=Micromonospora craterilacus TaxID=1655439 RepID=A0A2W2EYI1_9ACTN|nr:hypothetical protein [Micromonospora craterilacus]PZG14417.1 hypothetical protein C1I95_21735 [Micromonospora craterilacus]
MALTVAYDGQLSRVRLDSTGLFADAPVRVERSTNGVRWTPVRGGAELVPGGGVLRLDDYEFAPDVPNHFRVLGPPAHDGFGRTASGTWDTADSGQAWQFTGTEWSVSAGAGRITHASQNTTLINTLPGSYVDTHLRVHTWLGVVPAGASWEAELVARYIDGSNTYRAGVIYNPSGTVSMWIRRIVAGATTNLVGPQVIATGVTGSEVWIIDFAVAGRSLRAKAWQRDTPEPGWMQVATDSSLPAAGRVGVRSRRNAATTGSLTSWDRFVALAPLTPLSGQAGVITPTLGQVWLKSISRPFLNRAVVVKDYSDVERPERAGVFEIVGRSVPVVVHDVRGSRRWTLEILTETPDEAADFDLIMSSGDTMLIHTPASCDVPSGYVTIGTVSAARPARRSRRRVFSLPCVEVAAPGPDVVGATLTCQTLLNTYPTCSDVLAAHPTCADLLDLIGDPVDVVVP